MCVSEKGSSGVKTYWVFQFESFVASLVLNKLTGLMSHWALSYFSVFCSKYSPFVKSLLLQAFSVYRKVCCTNMFVRVIEGLELTKFQGFPLKTSSGQGSLSINSSSFLRVQFILLKRTYRGAENLRARHHEQPHWNKNCRFIHWASSFFSVKFDFTQKCLSGLRAYQLTCFWKGLMVAQIETGKKNLSQLKGAQHFVVSHVCFSK